MHEERSESFFQLTLTEFKKMNWNNIDLNDGYERNQNLIEPLSFDTLLLEVGCNLRNINPVSVTAQFEEDLQIRIDEAREVFAANLANIIKKAKQERKG